MKSLRLKISAIIIPIFIIALVALSSLNYIQAKKIIQEDIQLQLTEKATGESNAIKLWFNIYKDQVATYARSPIILSGTHEEAMDYLRREYKNNSLYDNILWADTNGVSYSALGSYVNIANRSFFQQALQGKTVISDPVISQYTGKLVVAVAAPIIRNGNITGVMCIPIAVDSIVKEILNIKIEKTGYAFLVSGDGLIIVHPDKQVANASNFFAGKNIDASLKIFRKNMLKYKTGFGSFKSNGTLEYAAYSNVPQTNWFLVIQVPEREINLKLLNFTNISLVTILVVLIIVIVIILLMAAHITKPIEILEAEANRISLKNYTISP